MSTVQQFDLILTGSSPRNNPGKQPGEGLNREQNLQTGDSSDLGRRPDLGRDQDLGVGRGDIGRTPQQDHGIGSDMDDTDNLFDDDLEDDVE